jgi:hypothetical protein
MKKIKEIIGSIHEFGWEDPDADGVGYYYLKVRFRRNKVPDDALDKALKGLIRKKVQVIQIE